MKVSILHIGKTAGTALFTALKEANKDEKLVLHGHAFTLEMVWKKFPNRNVVFGVREPIARYISAFNSRLREGLPRHHTPWSKSEQVAFSLFKTPNELAEALSSDDSMEKAAASLSMLGIKHVNKPLATYLGGISNLKKNKDRVKFVYLTETLNDDFEVMKKIFSLGEVSLPSDDVGAHRMPSGMSSELSDKAKENLTQWYQEDIELYNYCRQIHSQFIERFRAGDPSKDVKAQGKNKLQEDEELA